MWWIMGVLVLVLLLLLEQGSGGHLAWVMTQDTAWEMGERLSLRLGMGLGEALGVLGHGGCSQSSWGLGVPETYCCWVVRLLRRLESLCMGQPWTCRLGMGMGPWWMVLLGLCMLRWGPLQPWSLVWMVRMMGVMVVMVEV